MSTFTQYSNCCFVVSALGWLEFVGVIRASVNILQAGVRTSMVLNLDVRYALAIKSDVTLHTKAKTILAVCMHYARQARREQKWGPGNHYRGALSQPHSVSDVVEST